MCKTKLSISAADVVHIMSWALLLGLHLWTHIECDLQLLSCIGSCQFGSDQFGIIQPTYEDSLCRFSGRQMILLAPCQKWLKIRRPWVPHLNYLLGYWKILMHRVVPLDSLVLPIICKRKRNILNESCCHKGFFFLLFVLFCFFNFIPFSIGLLQPHNKMHIPYH